MKFKAIYFVTIVAAMIQEGISQEVSSNANLTAVLGELQAAVPACAISCFLTTVPASTCSLTDTECICTNEDLAEALGACLLTANCTATEQLKTLRFQKEMCGVEVRNDSPGIRVIIWTLYSIALFFVISRFIGRARNLSWKSWDDWTMLACLFALTPTSVIAELMLQHGLGQDIWMLEPDDITNTLFYFFIEENLYTFLVVFVKISILCLYLRIFTSPPFRLICYTFIGIVAAFGISCWISTGFNCTPITFMWEGWDGEHVGSCFDVSKQAFVLAIINITFDVIIFVLPIPQLLRLQMSLKRKLGVISMFVVGLFVTMCSILRLQYIVEFGNTTNPTYDYTHLAVWSLIEIDVGVICACMPGMASLFKLMWPKVFGTTHRTGPSPLPNSGKSLSSSGNSSARSKRGFSRMESGRYISKMTSVSLSFVDAGEPNDHKTQNDSKSDEFELVERYEQGRGSDRVPMHKEQQSVGGYKTGVETRAYRGKW